MSQADVAYQNLAPDFLDHDEIGGPVTGPGPAKIMMEKMYRILPDLHVSVEDIIAEGDKVMVRNIWSGTNSNGQKIQLKGFVLWKLKDGKIMERWATVTAPFSMETKLPVWLHAVNLIFQSADAFFYRSEESVGLKNSIRRQLETVSFFSPACLYLLLPNCIDCH